MSFDGAGTSDGLTVWRIEDFTPVEYPTEKYGRFHVGDSYIVLRTKSTGGKLSWNIHFWLGSETSQDESASAAMLSVELDDQLGGAAIQYRETQENESELFVSYFKQGLKYLPGGVKSGFHHYDPEQVEKRLFMVKGKRSVRVKEVPIDVSSMNKTDCFILDCGKGKSILVYMPPGARKMEKFRAIQVANEIRDEDHGGHASVEVIDEFSDDHQRFFDELGSGSQDDVKEDDFSDESADADASKVELYRVHDGSVELVTDTQPIRQEMLDNQDAFILLGRGSGVFIWIGKGATKEEKLGALNATNDFIKEKGYPDNTKISIVKEELETALFKQMFSVWNETLDPVFIPALKNVAEWNVSDLHIETWKHIEKSGGVAPGFMPDDGTGSKTIWRVTDNELVEVTTKDYLFGGDCYVILYNANNGKSLVYFWQGTNSSIEDKGASAIHAARIDNDDLGGSAIQIRVVQGEEPRHFYKMFGGRLITILDEKSSDTEFSYSFPSESQEARLFRVRGGLDGDNRDVRAEQIAAKAGNLSSDDAFIVGRNSNVWMWKGKNVNEQEKAAANDLCQRILEGVDIKSVDEGAEDDEFWEALGGLEEYPEGHQTRPILPVRLFQLIILPPARMTASEVIDFTKEDLVDDDVMILDSGRDIVVWIGSNSTKQEKELGLSLAEEYLTSDPSDRSPDNAMIMIVKEGQEPDYFKAAFPNWQN